MATMASNPKKLKRSKNEEDTVDATVTETKQSKKVKANAEAVPISVAPIAKPVSTFVDKEQV